MPAIPPTARPGTANDHRALQWHRAALAYQSGQPGITYEEAMYAIKYAAACHGGTSEITGHGQAHVSHPATLNPHTPQAGITAQELARQAQDLMDQVRASGPGRAISATEAVARVRRQMATA
jgi:hypothetical protein